MDINTLEEHLNPLKERLDTLEEEIKNLAETIDAFYDSLKKDRQEQNALWRKEMDRMLDGTDENPGILRSLANITRILDERLPKPKE